MRDLSRPTLFGDMPFVIQKLDWPSYFVLFHKIDDILYLAEVNTAC
jgi:hypothetical protein